VTKLKVKSLKTKATKNPFEGMTAGAAADARVARKLGTRTFLRLEETVCYPHAVGRVNSLIRESQPDSAPLDHLWTSL
jgi:hypothetical protein